MKQRKQYIIDKKFQLRTTFSIIGVVSVISLIIIGALSAGIVYNNIKIQNIYVIEDNIVHFLSSRNADAGAGDAAFKDAMKDIADNHSENMATLNRIIELNRSLLILLIAAVALQSLILYILLIRKTHRISGPIYVISGYMKEIIEGKWPNMRPLRDRDELRAFYHLFIEMVNTLKSRQEK